MPLTHEIHRSGTDLTVRLSGEFTFAENLAFRNVVDEVTACSPHKVSVDLSGLRSVDSAGLSMLVLLRERLSRINGTVTLLHPPAQVERVLAVVAFDKLFTIVR